MTTASFKKYRTVHCELYFGRKKKRKWRITKVRLSRKNLVKMVLYLPPKRGEDEPFERDYQFYLHDIDNEKEESGKLRLTFKNYIPKSFRVMTINLQRFPMSEQIALAA